MKKLSKIFAATICIVTMLACAAVFTACDFSGSEDKNGDGASFEMVVPDGAPALAAVNLIDEIQKNGKFGSLEKVEIVQSSSIGTRALDADFAIVPANLAANLYNKGQDIRLLATVTQGNLYVLGANSNVGTLSDLVGKRVFSIGQGSVPDYIFQTLLKNAGIAYEQGDKAVDGKVVITYVADGSGVMSQLVQANKNGSEAIGVIAEPAASKGLAQSGITQLFDLQQLWKDYTGSDTLGYPQAVLIAKASVCESNPEFIDELLSKMEQNGDFIVENSSRVSEILVVAYPQTSLNTQLSATTLERCNCNLVRIASAKEDYIAMLNAINAINPAAIGGKMPADGLYYSAK